MDKHLDAFYYFIIQSSENWLHVLPHDLGFRLQKGSTCLNIYSNEDSAENLPNLVTSTVWIAVIIGV